MLVPQMRPALGWGPSPILPQSANGRPARRFPTVSPAGSPADRSRPRRLRGDSGEADDVCSSKVRRGEEGEGEGGENEEGRGRRGRERRGEGRGGERREEGRGEGREEREARDRKINAFVSLLVF
eukprot:764561-Hanusia_phi.AAC.1